MPRLPRITFTKNGKKYTLMVRTTKNGRCGREIADHYAKPEDLRHIDFYHETWVEAMVEYERDRADMAEAMLKDALDQLGEFR